MNTLISIVASIFVLIASGTVLLQLRARGIASARCGEGYQDFKRHFMAQEIDEPILSSVYLYLEDWMRSSIVKEFPVRPTDTIAGIYGIVDGDVMDMLEYVMKQSNRQMPSEDGIDPHINLRTVEDVVKFVAQCPKQAT